MEITESACTSCADATAKFACHDGTCATASLKIPATLCLRRWRARSATFPIPGPTNSSGLRTPIRPRTSSISAIAPRLSSCIVADPGLVALRNGLVIANLCLVWCGQPGEWIALSTTGFGASVTVRAVVQLEPRIFVLADRLERRRDRVGILKERL